MDLYLFNPEHDLALASGESNYMAPASAQKMASDLALLPMWYAGSDDGILASSAYNDVFLKQMNEQLGCNVHLVTEPEVKDMEIPAIRCWGWNPALCKRLSGLGVPTDKLPSEEYLKWLRLHTHRKFASKVLSMSRTDEYDCGSSVYLTEELQWKMYIESSPSCLLKAPLSGSGKGLNWCKGEYTKSIAGWCNRVAKQQGGVMAEPIYNKVADFAMEFLFDGRGKVSFAGYSLFNTSDSGAYESNCLSANGMIEKMLATYVPLAKLETVRRQLASLLEMNYGGYYRGYAGVDMMICRFSSELPEYRIHPCVEINLRMNMGVVARKLFDRYFASDVEKGKFCISFHSNEGEALEIHRRMEAEHPLALSGGRIRKGYLALTPVTKHTSYRAWTLC